MTVVLWLGMLAGTRVLTLHGEGTVVSRSPDYDGYLHTVTVRMDADPGVMLAFYMSHLKLAP